MKKLIKPLALTALALAGLAACTRNEIPDSELTGPVAARISAGVATRASGTTWTAGDQIGVIVTKAAEDSKMAVNYQNAHYSTTDSGSTANFSSVNVEGDDSNTIYFDNGSEVTFAAYYPYSESAGVSTLPGTDGKVAISTSSQGTAAGREKTSADQETIDCLYASGATASKGNPSVNFAFSHVMAQIRFNITAEEGYEGDITSGTYKFGGLVHEGTFDVTDGAVSPAEGPAVTDWSLSTNCPSTAADGKVTYTAIIIPQSSESLSFSATVNGATLTTANYLSNTFEPGHTYTYNVTVSSSEVTVTGSVIYPWIDPVEETDFTPEDLYPGNLPSGEEYTILNNCTVHGTATADNVKLVVDPSVKELTFDSVNIDCGSLKSGEAVLTITSDLTLTLKGGNTIKFGLSNGVAGSCISVSGEGVTLTVKADDSDESASLTVTEDETGTGNNNHQGAILLSENANLVIESGIIDATGGYQYPAIGCGPTGQCGDITIKGGTVTATSGAQTAAIGAGGSGDASTGGKCGKITVSGGAVTCTMSGGNSVAIGAGFEAECGDIVISGGTLALTAAGSGAAIGTAGNGTHSSKCGDIYITDGITSVTVAGGSPAYLIGPGANSDTCGTVYLGGSSATDQSVESWTSDKLTFTLTSGSQTVPVYGWSYTENTGTYTWTKAADAAGSSD